MKWHKLSEIPKMEDKTNQYMLLIFHIYNTLKVLLMKIILLMKAKIRGKS